MSHPENSDLRPLTPAEHQVLTEFKPQITLSSWSSDSTHEYCHIAIPKTIVERLPADLTTQASLKVLLKDELQSLGITESEGWEPTHSRPAIGPSFAASSGENTVIIHYKRRLDAS